MDSVGEMDGNDGDGAKNRQRVKSETHGPHVVLARGMGGGWTRRAPARLVIIGYRATSFLENLGPGLATLKPDPLVPSLHRVVRIKLELDIDVASNSNSHCDGIMMVGLIG
jgi:hypothetical protein